MKTEHDLLHDFWVRRNAVAMGAPWERKGESDSRRRSRLT